MLAKPNESTFDRSTRSRSEHILLTRQQHPHPRGDNREQIVRARQAAEALFTSKSPETRHAVPDTAPPGPPTRKLRMLQIIAPPAERGEEVKAAATSEPQPTREVSKSDFSRIRTWVKYGMTIRQVAEFYGAGIDEIERIIRNP
ncbi:MAG: hypothetical protein WB760_09130 [Xanthobacteraceae bacterium]